MRLLLIEDNSQLSRLTQSALKNAGFVVDACHTAADAEAAVAAVAYDATVLDLGLPDMDGMDLLKQIRIRRQGVPIMILTARDGLKDRVAGLNAGADDYLLKPFAMEELIARIRALLRRPADTVPAVLRFRDLTLDPGARRLAVAGDAVAVSRREFDLLELLVRNAGRVVSKQSIDEKLHAFGDDVSENSVEAIVSRLRKRMRNAGANLTIVTVRGVGYMVGDRAG